MRYFFVASSFLLALGPSLHAQNSAYITNWTPKTVSVMTTVDETIVQTIPFGTFFQGIVVSPDGVIGYVRFFS